MNKKELENQLKILVLDTGTLNEFRQKVFASYNAGLITDKTKRQLLIELYDKADHQSIFYMRITDKKQMSDEIE